MVFQALVQCQKKRQAGTARAAPSSTLHMELRKEFASPEMEKDAHRSQRDLNAASIRRRQAETWSQTHLTNFVHKKHR